MLSERDVLGAIPGPPRVGGPDHPVPEPALGHDEGRSPDLLPSWVTGQRTSHGSMGERLRDVEIEFAKVDQRSSGARTDLSRTNRILPTIRPDQSGIRRGRILPRDTIGSSWTQVQRWSLSRSSEGRKSRCLSSTFSRPVMPESFVTRSGNSSMAIMPESGFVRVSEAQSSCSKRMRPCASSWTGSDRRKWALSHLVSTTEPRQTAYRTGGRTTPSAARCRRASATEPPPAGTVTMS